MLERKNAHRHAFEQVHVEGSHQVEPAFGLRARTREHQQVAQAIDPHERLTLHHGPQDSGHFSCANVLQGYDDGAVAGRQGAVARLAHVAAHALERVGAPHVVGAACIAHQRQAVGLQRTLQQKGGVVGCDGRARGQGDGAGQRGVEHVVGLEDVAQDGAHHLRHGCFFKVEADGRAVKARRGLAGRYDTVVATNDARLAGGCIGLGGWRRGFVGFGRVCHGRGWGRGSGRWRCGAGVFCRRRMGWSGRRLRCGDLAGGQRNGGQCVLVEGHGC